MISFFQAALEIQVHLDNLEFLDHLEDQEAPEQQVPQARMVTLVNRVSQVAPELLVSTTWEMCPQ